MNKGFDKSDVKYLRVYIAGSGDYFEYFRFRDGSEYDDDYTFEEFKEKYPRLVSYCGMADEDMLYLQIDLETNTVVNWPIGVEGEFTDYKIVDSGIYELLDDEENVLAEYQGYVPNCIGHGGYGDYFEFDVDENGGVNGLKFGKSEFKQFLSECEYDDEDDDY